MAILKQNRQTHEGRKALLRQRRAEVGPILKAMPQWLPRAVVAEMLGISTQALEVATVNALWKIKQRFTEFRNEL